MNKKIIWTIVIAIVIAGIIMFIIQWRRRKKNEQPEDTGIGTGGRPSNNGTFPLKYNNSVAYGYVWDMQTALNKMIAKGIISVPELVVDGFWGPKTDAAFIELFENVGISGVITKDYTEGYYFVTQEGYNNLISYVNNL